MADKYDVGYYLDYEEEAALSPLEKLYFTDAMFSKHSPCLAAMEKITNSDGDDEEAWETFETTMDSFLDFSFNSNWGGKRYDLVFFGVSGYTGYLMMEYLKRVTFKRNPEKYPDQYSIAFAGRTVAKIEEQRDRSFIGTDYEDIPIIQASYDDVISMIDLAKSSVAIVNVAGPYMLAQGEILIDACCHVGTNYMDVSGELPWTLRTMELHKHAQDGNACIIPSAAVAGGYPDILTYICAKDLREKHGEEVRYSICYCRGGGSSAGASGGTLASRGAMTNAGDASRKKMADPYAMGGFIPQFDRNGMKECTIKQGTGEVSLNVRKEDLDSVLSKISQCPFTGLWRMPWTYAYFDTRICRRTNQLLADLENQPYGRNFCFQEFGQLPPEALMQAAAVREAGGEVESAPAGPSVSGEKEALMAQGKYYKQGEGPPLEELGDAWIGFQVYCETASKKGTWACFKGGDGYFETARAAVEMAMVCIFDKHEVKHKGGVLNVTVVGQLHYLKRLIGSGVFFKRDWPLEESECCPLGQ